MRSLSLVLALSCACAGAPPPVPPTPVPMLPAVKADPIPAISWDELSGSIASVQVNGGDAGTRARLEAMFAAHVHAHVDRAALRATLDAASHVRGVADVGLRGVQLADGVKLLVDVRPEPIVRRIVAKDGTKRPVKLPTEARGEPGQPLDPQAIDKLVDQLRVDYVERGFYGVDVAWRSVPAGTNAIDVAIDIAPGDVRTLAAIQFTGNQHASRAELLGVVGTSLVIGDPVLDEQVERAELLLSAWYWDHGHANIKVRDAIVSTTAPITVTFPIEEGPVFHLGAIAITGVTPAEAKQYERLANLSRGDLFNRTAIAEARERVSDAVIAAGFPSATVLPLTKIDLAAQTIGLTFEIAKNP